MSLECISGEKIQDFFGRVPQTRTDHLLKDARLEEFCIGGPDTGPPLQRALRDGTKYVRKISPDV